MHALKSWAFSRWKGATNLALSFLAAKEKGETVVRQAVHSACKIRAVSKAEESPECL
jgi:hypothetical protein